MQKIISIIGQTSSGKSSLAIELAKFFDGEIVSADSRQVYKGLDWCSGKVTEEEQKMIKHHLLDITNLGEQFTLFDFQKLAYEKIDDILSRNKIPFLVGGTGLYSRAVVEGYSLDESKPNMELRKELENKSKEELIKICEEQNIIVEGEITARRLVRLLEKKQNITQKNQPRYDVLQIGILWPREEIYDRIKKRLEMRMPHMIEEIKNLIVRGADENFLTSLGLEAKHIILYLHGAYASYEEFFEELFKNERHFAKRQNTWYNKEKNIVWLDAKDNLFENAKILIAEFINKK